MIGTKFVILATIIATTIGLSDASKHHFRVHIHGKEASAWEQCGGIGYHGPTTCKPGLTCKKLNDWYSQCTPYRLDPGTVPWLGQCGGRYYRGPTTCAPGSSCKPINYWYSQCIPIQAAGPWEQCGGIGYHGPTTCKPGLTCKKLNDWYSQCTPNPTEPGTVPWWGQCGGKGYRGSRTCTAGSWCKRNNDYYYQCVPNSIKKGHTSKHSFVKSEESDFHTKKASAWEQCGGIGYHGPTTCKPGLTCKKLNDWYSQCTPNPTEPGTVPWWGQCGGKEYHGSTTCTAGSWCKRNNDYYYQCVPSSQ